MCDTCETRQRDRSPTAHLDRCRPFWTPLRQRVSSRLDIQPRVPRSHRTVRSPKKDSLGTKEHRCAEGNDHVTGERHARMAEDAIRQRLSGIPMGLEPDLENSMSRSPGTTHGHNPIGPYADKSAGRDWHERPWVRFLRHPPYVNHTSLLCPWARFLEKGAMASASQQLQTSLVSSPASGNAGGEMITVTTHLSQVALRTA